MNTYLPLLQPYPFEKLHQLKDAVPTPSVEPHISLSIGEPQHAPPQFVLDTLKDNLGEISRYPSTIGTLELRQVMSDWASRRFQLTKGSLSPEQHILPVNGTREALFAFIQACFDSSSKKKQIVMPNPFYQIYEGAALLAGAQPVFLNCESHNQFLPDFDAVSDKQWQSCQVLFICTPGNPTGAVLPLATLQKLISLADKFNFIIASDECYSELYFDENAPPPGLLQACAVMGRDDYRRCIVFHSLSKRSNLPGLRSGFVAGDSALIKPFLLYRTYHGCAMPLPSQLASIAAWKDEGHVQKNRDLYREKFAKVHDILSSSLRFTMPQAGFYLWPETPIDETLFAQQLYAQQNVTVLPGSYLARDAQGGNPGRGHVRMALAATLAHCIEAAERIKHFVHQGNY